PADPPMSISLPAALADKCATISRFGGLSLGESSYLVDAVTTDSNPPGQLVFITPDVRGFYSLPVWVDHVNRARTILKRFRLSEPAPVADGLPGAWCPIGG